MKKLFIIIAVISFYAFASLEATYSVDINVSNIHWLGKKTSGQHEGDVKLQSGKINFSNSIPVSGAFVLDMNSITVTDIKDAADNKSLVDHLKEEDFFGVAKNPSALILIKKFESIKADNASAPNYTATADLTIKGVKNEIQFPARVDVSGDKATANADITIDRTKWKITYKSKSILGSTADKFIHDDMHFSVKLVLQK